MADAKATKAPAPKKGAPGKGGKSEKGGKAPQGATDPAPKVVDGTPRLLAYYHSTVRERLKADFALGNPMQVPRIEKIILNVGLGEASKNPKALDAVVDEMVAITGQRPVVTRAKKAISNFGLRQGVPVGVMVTLRGPRMYEFLDRFISLAVPRIRDFRGLPNRSFDGRGNYSFGIKEQLIFPEIDYDKVDKIHGMDITIVTSAGRDDLALALLREFGWPFRGETPKRAAA
ncbi:MAG: 50S ribosomal protein L5 [Gemmatimonadales bacterium]